MGISKIGNHKVIIALGTNLGNKKNQIERATRLIETKIGLIIKAGKVYASQSIGFDGPDFYNTVLLIHTIYTPQDVLDKLKNIESEMGRAVKVTDHYESRPIDLDIIFYDNIQFQSERLEIPHKHWQERNFAVLPLLDFCKEWEIENETIQIGNIASKMEPLEPVDDFEITLSRKRYPIQRHNFIAIEGNIGSGKTSLTHKIGEDFTGKEVLERFADNPFLPLFYKEQERYAFSLEMSFLADRYQQLHDEIGQQDLFKEFTVADYYVVKSLIFSKITLSEEEYTLYKRLFYMMYKELVKPELYIYLYQTEERLLDNIKKRGREYEQDIQTDYLMEIQKGYADFIKTQDSLKIKVIDVTELDFVNNHEDYITILDQINS
ncbi:2-amino-4-hydroxy-6-hydroxymethyldihydropteridine diphosphokinase [Nonlabens tegetincola]|nr:2-amino-4-hydroxy-6-hydroxymethyldihydropteridine diphosphokinase [Nonlabens tegetincola]